MPVFKCKMCGGNIEFHEGATVGVCDSCGTRQTLPRLDDDKRANLYDRANHFRRKNDFDRAMGLYEQILSEDNTDAEAYWSLVLCRYGVEYVEDPSTHKRVPTVNRTQLTSIFRDEDYKSALQYADCFQKSLYEKEAGAIDDIQKKILEISSREDPFDVFICYKEKDDKGERTRDSVLANELYHQLTAEGFKVFYSRITLEDKLGTDYEPYIFAALNSARVMVVIGTKPEYFKAVWVKNEWSRFLAIVRDSGGRKVLIPAYRDMDPYDLPEEFSHLQALDMSKLGFMLDLIRGIKKIISEDEASEKIKKKTAEKVREKSAVNVNNIALAAPLLERAFLFLEDGNWKEAWKFCESVLNIEPRNARAYLGKLMAEMHVTSQEDLADCEETFEDNDNFKKVIRFGDEKLSSQLQGYIEHIKERNENTRLTRIYNRAMLDMEAAGSERAYRSAADMFESISGFMDAGKKAEECRLAAQRAGKKARKKAVITITLIIAACILIPMTIKKCRNWAVQKRYDRFEAEKDDLQVGDTCQLGVYKVLFVKEPIEWTVLYRDDESMLLVSTYLLTSRQYDEEKSGGSYISWRHSSIRDWLNDEFFNKAFGPVEQTLIRNANASAEADSGNDITDPVFLLTRDEAETYFQSDEARQTAYADSKRVVSQWWLYTNSQTDLNFVDYDGSIDTIDESYRTYGVRPAIWIDLNA